MTHSAAYINFLIQRASKALAFKTWKTLVPTFYFFPPIKEGKLSIHHSPHLINFIISLFQAYKSELINNSGTSSNLLLGCVEKTKNQGSLFSGLSPPFFLFTTFLFQSLSSYLISEAFFGFLYLKLRTLVQFYPIPKKVSYIAFYTFVP